MSEQPATWDEPEDDPGGAGAAPATGHPAVDAALQAVVATAGAGPGEQVSAFQAADRTLRETLESIDEG